jgi:quercetin dioxygenase-like cupin family protein
MEIRRYGIGHRRADGPPGTRGVRGGPIHGDARGVLSELAFGRRALMEPHLNPNPTWFVVIEGGGWVQVGDERTRIAAGEAVLFPPGIPHGAWTDATEMRAIVVEFDGGEDPVLAGLIGAGSAESDRADREAPGEPGGRRPVERGVGGLARPPAAPAPDPESGEPS